MTSSRLNMPITWLSSLKIINRWPAQPLYVKIRPPKTLRTPDARLGGSGRRVRHRAGGSRGAQQHRPARLCGLSGEIRGSRMAQSDQASRP